MRPHDQIIIEVVEDDDGFEVRALWRDRPIGRLLCSEDNGQFILADVHVESVAAIRWLIADRFLVWLGFPRREVCFRRRGVGDKLLGRFLAEARSRGGKEVIGFISDEDLRVSPFLPAWYERHGFLVRDGGYHPVLGEAAKTIALGIGGEDHSKSRAAEGV